MKFLSIININEIIKNQEISFRNKLLYSYIQYLYLDNNSIEDCFSKTLHYILGQCDLNKTLYKKIQNFSNTISKNNSTNKKNLFFEEEHRKYCKKGI